MGDDVNLLQARLEPIEGLIQIGLIVLATDEIGEGAFKSLMPGRVRVVTTRLDYDGEPIDSFEAVSRCLPERLHALAFSCTSGTVATGAERLLEVMAAARPGIGHTSPAIAALAAFRHLGIGRIALLTPYSPAMHRGFPGFFRRHGVEVAYDATFGLGTDREIGEISRESLFEGACQVLERAEGADALFVSCTATPVVPHLAELERTFGLPVISSSEAMAWHALTLCGWRGAIEGSGSLMRAL